MIAGTHVRVIVNSLTSKALVGTARAVEKVAAAIMGTTETTWNVDGSLPTEGLHTLK